MAKKCMILRQKKRAFLTEKIFFKRMAYKQIILNLKRKNINKKKIIYFTKKLQKLPRDSNFDRLRNCCRITGRTRGYIQQWGFTRMIFRKYAEKGYLPGVIKSSW